MHACILSCCSFLWLNTMNCDDVTGQSCHTHNTYTQHIHIVHIHNTRGAGAYNTRTVHTRSTYAQRILMIQDCQVERSLRVGKAVGKKKKKASGRAPIIGPTLVPKNTGKNFSKASPLIIVHILGCRRLRISGQLCDPLQSEVRTQYPTCEQQTPSFLPRENYVLSIKCRIQIIHSFYLII